MMINNHCGKEKNTYPQYLKIRKYKKCGGKDFINKNSAAAVKCWFDASFVGLGSLSPNPKQRLATGKPKPIRRKGELKL